MNTAIISEQGIRETLEDNHYLDIDFGGKGWVYCGVYDGHNGKFAADYAAEKLHQVFLDKLLSGLTPQQAFINSYEEISLVLNGQKSGTTAVDIFIKDGMVCAANAGDARAIIIGKNKVIQLTVDHRVDDAAERKRIEDAGGRIVYSYVSNGAGGIMPTRTIGDEPFKSVGVIATPSVNEYKISPEDMMLLVACDGLFDKMDNNEVAAFACNTDDVHSLVEVLKQEVLVNRAGSDNLTIIAVGLNE